MEIGGGFQVQRLAKYLLETCRYWEGVFFKGAAPGGLTRLQQMATHQQYMNSTNYILWIKEGVHEVGWKGKGGGSGDSK